MELTELISVAWAGDDKLAVAGRKSGFTVGEVSVDGLDLRPLPSNNLTPPVDLVAHVSLRATCRPWPCSTAGLPDKGRPWSFGDGRGRQLAAGGGRRGIGRQLSELSRDAVMGSSSIWVSVSVNPSER